MKIVNKIEDILDVLGQMAVMVVREEDHKILYLNQKAQEANTEFRENMICYGMWKGSCKNCPVETIGEQEYKKVIGYDTVSENMVDICAIRILWKGEVPSFVITVSAHIMTEEEKELDLSRKWLIGALSQVYEMTLVSNLSKDKYILFHNQGRDILPRKGDLSLFLDSIAKNLAGEQKKLWQNRFSIEKLIDAFSRGEQNVIMDLYFEKKSCWLSYGCFLIENPYSQEILCVILIKDITKQKKWEKQQQTQMAFTYTTMQGASGKYIVTENDVYFLEASKKYFELFDMDMQKYNKKGRKMMPWLEEEERQKYIRIIIEQGKKKEPFVIEMPKKLNNGSINWYQVQGMVIGEQEGYPIYYSVFMDISEKKRLELEQKITFNSLSGGVAKIRLDDKLTILEANRCFFDMFGEISDIGFCSKIYGIDRKVVQKEFTKLIQASDHFKMELRMLSAKNEVIWIHMEGNEIRRENGIPVYLFVMMDVTNYMQMRMQLEEVQEKYHKTIVGASQNILEYDSSRDCFVVVDEAKSEQYYKNISFQYYLEKDNIVFSENIKNQIGIKMCYDHFTDYLKKRNIVFEGDWHVLKNVYKQCKLDTIAIKAQLRLLTAKDCYEWFELYCNPLWDEQKKKCVKITGTLININALRQMQSEATAWREKARKDPLTKLYNRVIFTEKVTALLKECKTGALIFVDVDNFKKVNDTLGHAIGDDVLMTVAKRLCHSFREKEDVIARYGGDEFVVFVKDMPSYEALRTKLKQLQSILHQKYGRGEISWDITGSIGAALYPQDAIDYKTLLEQADSALYVSKKRGKNQFTLYADCQEELLD
ncbi:MAG TPA: diguanylate cyclase [Candidatus Coprocola pullicola]|nr:diguanylate cyclase [Candidatus Coprocola pullicola]